MDDLDFPQQLLVSHLNNKKIIETTFHNGAQTYSSPIATWSWGWSCVRHKNCAPWNAARKSSHEIKIGIHLLKDVNEHINAFLITHIDIWKRNVTLLRNSNSDVEIAPSIRSDYFCGFLGNHLASPSFSRMHVVGQCTEYHTWNSSLASYWLIDMRFRPGRNRTP